MSPFMTLQIYTCTQVLSGMLSSERSRQSVRLAAAWASMFSTLVCHLCTLSAQRSTDTEKAYTHGAVRGSARSLRWMPSGVCKSGMETNRNSPPPSWWSWCCCRRPCPGMSLAKRPAAIRMPSSFLSGLFLALPSLPSRVSTWWQALWMCELTLGWYFSACCRFVCP